MTSARNNNEKSQEFKFSVRDSRKDLQSNVLMVIYSRFSNHSSALHGDNRHRFLYQIRSLRKDSGINKVDFKKKSYWLH